MIERAAILASGPVVDIPPSLVTSGAPHRPSRAVTGAPDDEPLTLADAEARHIRRILDRTGWAVAGPAGAARLLGVPESTLRSRMKKLGIRRKAPAGG